MFHLQAMVANYEVIPNESANICCSTTQICFELNGTVPNERHSNYDIINDAIFQSGHPSNSHLHQILNYFLLSSLFPIHLENNRVDFQIFICVFA